MDLAQIVTSVTEVVKAIMESGIIEKIIGTIEKVAPQIVNIIGNVIEIVSK